MLPTFVVIGAAKAGTTSLHAYLASHPQVFMSEEKELNFFIESMNWPRGRAWYESNFADAGDALAVGESSPLYSAAHWYDGVPERLASLLPGARLVYLVRQPLDRMRSHYLMHRTLGLERRPAERALRENAGYLDSSRYAFQLDRFARFIPDDRILVLRTEDLLERREEVLARTFAFLGVDPDWHHPAVDVERHRSVEKELRPPLVLQLQSRRGFRAAARFTPGPLRQAFHRLTTRPADPAEVRLPAELERELLDRLRPDVARLGRWLGPDFDGWGLLDGTVSTPSPRTERDRGTEP